MKKCKGCGCNIQVDNENASGFAKSLDQDYCQRCFRLTHYGDITKLNSEKVNNCEILDIYKEFKDDVFVLIIDSFDALSLAYDNLLSIFKDNKFILIINKIDLLPLYVKDDKLSDLFTNVLESIKNDNIINCLLTYKDDPNFNNLFLDTIDQIGYDRFVFVGRVNAGKSTIINKLMKTNDLTVSTYPGTTINTNEIKYDKYTFIDTPGLIDEKSFVSHLDKNRLKQIVPNKCIKPKVFQLYENQSYFIEGLIRIDIRPIKHSSITFYIKNELDVHRTKSLNADSYFNKHISEMTLKLIPMKSKVYQVNNESGFYIKGLGYFRIVGKASVKISVSDKVDIIKSEVNF